MKTKNKSETPSVKGVALLLCCARVLMTLALLAAPLLAQAKDLVPVKGTFDTIHQDTFGFDPLLGPIVSVIVTGEGNISHLGKTTAFTDDQLGILASGLLSATYTLTAANGDTLVLWLIGPSEFDVAAQSVTFSGAATVLGGTGRFAGATGTGTFSGWATFDEPFGLPTNQGPGAFTLDLNISSPGAAKN